MRVRVEIECDGAAFDGPFGDECQREVARLLLEASRWAGEGPLEESDALTLRDVNGNAVGKLTVTDAPEVAR